MIRNGRGYNHEEVLLSIKNRSLTPIAMIGSAVDDIKGIGSPAAISIRWIPVSCGAHQPLGWGEDLTSEAFLNLCEDIEQSGMTLPGSFASVRDEIKN